MPLLLYLLGLALASGRSKTTWFMGLRVCCTSSTWTGGVGLYGAGECPVMWFTGPPTTPGLYVADGSGFPSKTGFSPSDWKILHPFTFDRRFRHIVCRLEEFQTLNSLGSQSVLLLTNWAALKATRVIISYLHPQLEDLKLIGSITSFIRWPVYLHEFKIPGASKRSFRTERGSSGN